MFRRNW